MTTGRKPKPTALKLIDGNPGKRAINRREPRPPASKPSCPAHLSPTAKAEWRRIAGVMHRIGILTQVDRAALAAYCQAYGRWVEAEKKLQETPALVRTPSGYVQQSPWLSIAHKQLELMGRYMAELGITPAARSRVAAVPGEEADPSGLKIQIVHRLVPAPGTPSGTPSGTGAEDAEVIEVAPGPAEVPGIVVK